MYRIEFVCIGLAFALFGCSQTPEYKETKFPIKMQQTIKKDIPHFIPGIGTLIASLEVDIKAQATGLLTSVLFDDGQRVNQGDLLFTIDPRPYEANLESAKAQLAEDEARLSYAIDFADTYGLLVGKEYVARLDYEQGVQNVEVSEAAIEYDKAQIETAEINLSYTQIRAPMEGFVGLRQYDPGNLVVADEDTVLVTLRKIVPITVAFSVPGTYVYQIQQAQKINPLFLEAILPSDKENPLIGQLTFIDNTVNRTTGMIQLQGRITNEDMRGWPGEFVHVKLLLDILEDQVLAPKMAVKKGQEGYYVFLVDRENMTVATQDVDVGIEYKSQIVITSGLKEGDYVVTDGQINLFDGAKVYLPEKSEDKKA